MLDVIVGDCEVFKHYFLFVAKELPSGNIVVIENATDLHKFYRKHKNGIWVFYNAGYDSYIIKGKLIGMDVKSLSDYIVAGNPGWRYSTEFYKFPLICFDAQTTPRGLKVLEGFMGEDIRETTVPFDLDRKLTRAEKDEVIKYCTHDVEQTYKVLQYIKPDFQSHLELVKMFNLPMTSLSKTKARLSAEILKATLPVPIDDEFKIDLPACIDVGKYKNVQEWFTEMLTAGQQVQTDAEKAKLYARKYETVVAGVPHTFGWGGVHGALLRYHVKGRLVNLDVASLYPSIMINFGFVSRACEDPALYKKIYEDRLEYKRNGDPRNKCLKLVLNSAYGVCKDRYSKMYDPHMANAICLTGQLLLLDLIDKIEDAAPEAKLVNVNTDGVLYLIPDDECDKILMSVVDLWMQRTGLTMERTDYVEIHQRDVNNYVLVDAQGKTKGKGVVKSLNPLDYDLPIINEALINALVHNIPVEETIGNCDEYIKFQKIYKLQGKYTRAYHNGKRYANRVYRVFASDSYRDTTLYKGYAQCGGSDEDSETLEIFGGAPTHLFIENGVVSGRPCPDNLDKKWYIEEAKRRLQAWRPESAPLLDGLM